MIEMNNLNAPDIIAKKRDGIELTKNEIEYLVQGYVEKSVPDYQMAAFLMAVYFQSMTDKELFALTETMAHSGRTLDFGKVGGFRADKHSTGGVGDSVSLILVSLVASLGLKMGKLAGRALGHTGGTMDKLESIPGFRANLSFEEMVGNLRDAGAFIAEHTEEFVPADHKIYALRNETGTVKSLPLIASSVMSKKLACGPEGLVIDVKVGSGAFFQDRESADKFAQSCVSMGSRADLRVSALLTAMDQPLGHSVGNALEVKEALTILRGGTDTDLAKVVLHLASELLIQAEIAKDIEHGIKLARNKLENGDALEKFREIIDIQGGDPEVIDRPSLLPGSGQTYPIEADRSGFITGLEALKIAQTANLLGAGRRGSQGSIDHSVGIVLKRKVGQKVQEGEIIAELHFSEKSPLEQATSLCNEAIEIQESSPTNREVIIDRIH